MATETRATTGGSNGLCTVGRGGNGKFTRTLAGAKRDTAAAEMRSRGHTFDEIAEALGYADRGKAHQGVQRALAAVPVAAVEELRKTQQALIDRLKREALAVLERQHVAHSNGKVVQTVVDGVVVDVLDDGPKLAAINTLRGLLEREAKLHGIDAPTRTVVEGDELVIRIAGVDTGQV